MGAGGWTALIPDIFLTLGDVFWEKVGKARILPGSCQHGGAFRQPNYMRIGRDKPCGVEQ